MNFYNNATAIRPDVAIRAHPLLLSLTEAFDASEANPDISTVSENDERVLRSNFYTSPNAFPPLEMHFSGQIGPYILQLSPNQNCYFLIEFHTSSWLPKMHG